MNEKAILFALNADELARKGKHRKAVRICRKGLKKFPDYQAAYIILANSQLALKKKKSAVKELQKGLRFIPASKILNSSLTNALNAKSSIFHNAIKSVIAGFVIFASVMLGGIAIVPAVFPDFSTDFAERLRNYMSPQFVAKLEEVSFDAQDYYNNLKYKLGDTQQIDFEDTRINKHTLKPDIKKTIDLAESNIPDSLSKMIKNVPATGNKDSVKNDIQIEVQEYCSSGWLQYLTFNNEAVLFKRKIHPDESKPYCQVFFIKIRLDKISLHISPNGKIPMQMQNDRLIGAFNGGFRHIHGGYGIKVNGEEFYKPKNNIGTLAIYKNGNVDIIKWNDSFQCDSNIISYRQNCPLIIENGEITDEIGNSPSVWGFTVDNKTLTWRSGIGISQDKKYLVYGFGKSLSVNTLAKAFKQIGISNAMQLDINWGWTKFVLYSMEEELKAKGIIGSTSVRKYEFLKKSENSSIGRDFFYLTYKK